MRIVAGLIAWPIVAAFWLTVSAVQAEPAAALATLSLADAAELAVQKQPQLESYAAEAKAARERAVAAGQLPDPKLNVGLKDLPIQGDPALSLGGDNFTMFTVGVAQEFPRLEKRRLQRQRAEDQAKSSDLEYQVASLKLRLDASKAWIDVWEAERSLALTDQTLVEAMRQAQATEIAYTTATAGLADVHAARIGTSLLQDDADKWRTQSERARAQLQQWIGDAARRSIDSTLPEWPEPPATAELPELLRLHPHINLAKQEVAAKATELALAEQAYRPDWRLEVGYGHRTRFPDFVSVQAGIDLPVFTNNRQDRGVTEKNFAKESAEQKAELEYRVELESARDAVARWQLSRKRLQRFDTDILPQAALQTAAALSTYSSGGGGLNAVLQSRRSALDYRLQRVALAAAAGRARLDLEYLTGQ